MPQLKQAPARAVARRLPAARRREQLLAKAADYVRKQGTDGLTLAVLAEQAGVTKPITYQHFGSRAGLLMALYEFLEVPLMATVRERIQRAAPTQDAVVQTISEAYFDCAMSAGREFGDIAAALSASRDMENFRSKLSHREVQEIQRALGPWLGANKAETRVLLVGVLGAGQALAAACLNRRISRRAATRALATLMRAALAQSAH